MTIKSPKLVGMKHWYTTDDERYLVFLYRTSDFEGDLRSTEEGEVRWVAREKVVHMDLAYDMLNLLRVFEEDNLSEDLAMTIEELDLSLRSFNCLKRAGFDRVGDIIKVSESELKTIKNFGKKSLTEVIEKLDELGLSLKDE